MVQCVLIRSSAKSLIAQLDLRCLAIDQLTTEHLQIPAS